MQEPKQSLISTEINIIPTSLNEESQSEESNDPPDKEKISFTLYPRRWLVLISYCLLSIVCGSSWLCFPAVSNILRQYYNIDILAVNLLSIVFGIAIVIFSIPFAVILDKFGLSVTLKLAGFFNAVGAIIKYFGDSQENGYWFLLCGNFFTAIAVAGFLFLPGKIAASWFGDRELGRATSICVAFDALGTGLGFLHATTMIRNNKNADIVKEDIQKFLLSQLVPSIIVFVLVLTFVKDRPKTAPNYIELQVRRHDDETENYLLQQKQCEIDPVLQCAYIEDKIVTNSYYPYSLRTSIYKLLKNSDFQLIFHMQGIVASIEGVYEMLLNEMLIEVYPGKEQAIGILGFVAVMLGFTSNIIVGAILDKTGCYRKVSFSIFFLTTLLSIVWFTLMECVKNFMAKAVVFCILMSVSTSYYTIAFAHSAQVTSSISPSATGVMLVLTSQVYDTITSFAGTEILAMFGPTAVNACVIAICFIATLLTFFVQNKRTPHVGDFV